MSLVQYQSILSRLATLTEVRAQFEADRKGFLATEQITGPYAEALMKLDDKQLRFFAESLINKRWGVISMLLHPWPELKQKLRPHFVEYAGQTAIKGGPVKHQQDAVAFIEFMLKRWRTVTLKERKHLRKQRVHLREYLALSGVATKSRS